MSRSPTGRHPCSPYRDTGAGALRADITRSVTFAARLLWASTTDVKQRYRRDTLILAIQKEFPQARFTPCEPIEGEDIHLWAYLPMQPEERLGGQDRILEIEQIAQDKYDVQTVVVAMRESI